MNTTGMIRGYMSKNMQAQEFIKVVMSMNLIKKLQSPYGVDRFLLQEFEKQGFKFDKNRSQYIQYCFGIYKMLMN
ncbi:MULTISPECIES: hypothetical protein [Clostridium]|uniref:Uncharacterized protein n=1 Tax=Clostridium frigoriphilum TaxID=443253 RepID=A0ABU7UTP5_9CLOT|nr:hypothetical protein [Clostridium sp. DSM 17811]MBU3102174.1 hypothetical protein [Clostridium sp. DSM 17811]